MIEIFIPEIVNKRLTINIFLKEQKNMLKKAFYDLKIKKISSDFFSGSILKLDKFDEDLFIFANGAFGKKYFYEYDILKNKFYCEGISIYTEKKYFKELENISENIDLIIKELNSQKLLTNTKKEIFRKKIVMAFFTISGVYFSLKKLLEKTEKNIEELGKIKGKVEYEAEGKLLKEISETKKIELEAEIMKLEARSKLFFDTILYIFS